MNMIAVMETSLRDMSIVQEKKRLRDVYDLYVCNIMRLPKSMYLTVHGIVREIHRVNTNSLMKLTTNSLMKLVRNA